MIFQVSACAMHDEGKSQDDDPRVWTAFTRVPLCRDGILPLNTDE